jgi:hypothetical protein
MNDSTKTVGFTEFQTTHFTKCSEQQQGSWVQCMKFQGNYSEGNNTDYRVGLSVVMEK